MAKDYDIAIADGKASIRTPYNIEFVQRVKLMGGKWDSSSRRWVVDERRVEAVRAAMTEVYGRSDLEPGELVKVRVTFDNGYHECCGPITLFGATIASASGRDSGARVGDRVVFLSGEPYSGGSAKNWLTVIRSGSQIEIYDVPAEYASKCIGELPASVHAEIIRDDIDRDALRAERDRLLARIAEIDKLLTGN